MRASTLRGRAIVTLADAAKVGHVTNVLFDAPYRQLVGFLTKSGTFSREEAVIRGAVSAIGPDAITVASPDAVNVRERYAELTNAVTSDQVNGTRVVTEGGTLIGSVSDVDLDDEAQIVLAYVLSAPLWDRVRHNEPTIEASQVLRLGEGGIMIVPDDVAKALSGDGT